MNLAVRTRQWLISICQVKNQIKKMNLNQKEIGQRFESFQQKAGIADIIESRSLLSMIKFADNEKLPMFHEKILFATIAPEMKVLSVLGHFESVSSEEHNKMEEKTRFHNKLEQNQI